MPADRRWWTSWVFAAVVGASACGVGDGTVGPTRPAAGIEPGPGAAPSAAAAAEPVDPDISAAGSSSAAGPSGVPGRAGKVILIDPGHNGGNGRASAAINRKVPDGRGRTKPCNTTGTSTNNGYPEHKFAWNVAQRVRSKLEASGVLVKMTRDNDTGVGPCVDVRGKKAEELNVDGVVSIHADGAAPGGRGFHVIYSSPPLDAAQGEPSISLASALRDALRNSGMQTSTYIGKAGLSARGDLAGLNLSRRPAAMVECGNMRNAADAVQLTSPEQQDKIGDAIADGVLAWLARSP